METVAPTGPQTYDEHNEEMWDSVNEDATVRSVRAEESLCMRRAAFLGALLLIVLKPPGTCFGSNTERVHTAHNGQMERSGSTDLCPPMYTVQG